MSPARPAHRRSPSLPPSSSSYSAPSAARPGPAERAPARAGPGLGPPPATTPGSSSRSGRVRRGRTIAIAGHGRGDRRSSTGRAVALRAGDAAGRSRRLRADPRSCRVSVDHRLYRDADPTGEQTGRSCGACTTPARTSRARPGTAGTVDVDIDGRQASASPPASGVVVAVIDNGVDFSHPDLAARAWTNPGESGGGKRRPTASTTTATATSTTSTAGTSATTTTRSTIRRGLPRHARRRHDRGVAQRRRASWASPRTSRSWP